MRETARAAWLGLSWVALLSLPAPAQGEDGWPQWRGPRRDGTAEAFWAPERWPDALERVWRRRVGGGHASPVVAAGRVFAFSREGDHEVLSALDLATGAPLWRSSAPAPYRPAFEASEHGAGPFSTPAVADGRIFTLGIGSVLSAHDVADGRVLWRRRYAARYPQPGPQYGTSLSPLAAQGRVFVYVGHPGEGALEALDARAGDLVWRLEGDGPPYGSPVLAEIAGVRQIVTLTQRRLVGVDAATGELLWERPFPVEWDNTTGTPVVDAGRIVVSSYGTGVHALRPRKTAAGWSVSELWHTRAVSAFMSNPVLADGVLYGFSHLRKGQLFAVDSRDGRVLWATPGRMAENAYLLLAAGWLLVLDADGRLLVVRPGSAGFDPVASYGVSDEPVWAHPAVVGEHLLIKSGSELTLWRVGGGENRRGHTHRDRAPRTEPPTTDLQGPGWSTARPEGGLRWDSGGPSSGVQRQHRADRAPAAAHELPSAGGVNEAEVVRRAEDPVVWIQGPGSPGRWK